MGPFAPLDWDGVRLVAFDMDGTLYSQNRLRAFMLRDLLMNAASRLSLDTLKIIQRYRRIREQLAELEAPQFEARLLAETAACAGHAPEKIRSVVDEWIERRPLPYLAACRYPGVVELFAALRREGKIIGILSDYPAGAKLSVLGLDADHIVCASDEAVGLLKPNPRGLRAMIDAAAVSPLETILIGDRTDRDGLAATRTGARPLIRSAKPLDGWQTFATFDDPLFAAILGG
jgi:putative hydrolase of the HAD superfamily